MSICYARVNPKEFPDALPVHEAAHTGDIAKLKEALKADPSSATAVTVANMTALHLAVKSTSHPEMISELLKNGASPDARDINNETPLMMASRMNSASEIISFMVGHGADCSLRRNDGYTALMLAVMEKACPVIPDLLKCEADPNMVGPGAFSALTMASADRSFSCLEELLKPNMAGTGKVVLDEPTDGGQTALMIAANNHFPKGVELLLKAEAAVGAFDDNGTTPLMHAVNGNSMESLELMLKSKDGASTLDLANVDGATALMIASKAITGKPFISKLLDMGANPNLAGSITGVPGDLMTALMIAVHEKQTETVRLLINAGADPAPSNRDGYTALHMAAQMGYVEGVTLLLEAGAPLDALEKSSKMTPFGIAVEHNIKKVIDAFREFNGDDPYEPDEEVAKMLTHSTFTDAINGRFAMVFFYSPTCEHCQRLHVVWEEVARTVKSNGNDLVIAKIDATDSNVAQTHKVSEFPNIQVFEKGHIDSFANSGKGHAWKGARFYDALMHVIEKYTVGAEIDWDAESGFSAVPQREGIDRNMRPDAADAAIEEKTEEEPAEEPPKFEETEL